MREIKFRAWNISQKRFIPISSICFDGGEAKVITNGSEPHRYPLECPADENILMQATGLRDKNGVEIYEGDILKTATDKPMVVGWSERFASFVIHREGWAFQHWFGEACDPKDCEIIGNIHQNPELL